MKFELNNQECEEGIRLFLEKSGFTVGDGKKFEIEFTKLRSPGEGVVASVGIVETEMPKKLQAVTGATRKPEDFGESSVDKIGDEGADTSAREILSDMAKEEAEENESENKEDTDTDAKTTGKNLFEKG